MTSHSSYQEAVLQFSNYLKAHHKRCTAERFRILKCIFNQTDHFDAHKLYSDLEKESFHVSLATIYNTLEVLCECGLLLKHRFENVNSKYELSRSSHIHLICNECGKVGEIKSDKVQDIFRGMSFHGFNPDHFTIYAYGTCTSCQRRRKRRDSKVSSTTIHNLSKEKH